MSFSPDGSQLASGSDDGTVKLWNSNLDDLLSRRCDWLHDYLSTNPRMTDADRELCGIAPRDAEAEVP